MKTDEQIYDDVEREVRLMILEVRDGLPISNRTDCFMNFVTKAITRTIIAKNQQSRDAVNSTLSAPEPKGCNELFDTMMTCGQIINGFPILCKGCRDKENVFEAKEEVK